VAETDRIDQRIIALLRDDARRSFRDIGEQVGLSAPAVKRRVDRLEDSGVITGFTALLSPAALGWITHGVVSLFCDGAMSADEIRKGVAAFPEVTAAYTVAGQASAMLHVRARDTRHLEETLERLRGIAGVTATQTQVVLSALFERPVEAA
jgi:DNA-binding Lrp family transcriptional regulator